MMNTVRAGTVTISTSKSSGEGVDESGPALRAFVESIGGQVVVSELIPDDRPIVEETLRALCARSECDLVLTSGGTGLSPDDVTPEATRAVIEREIPGIAEAIRLSSRKYTPHWMLSRGLAGTCGATLIINFPGSPKSIEQAGAAIQPAPQSRRQMPSSESKKSRRLSAVNEWDLSSVWDGFLLVM